MAKIVINNATGISSINSNFDKVESEFNNKVLYRDNPVGEPNEMLNNLDMNNKRILNLPQPISLSEPARLQDILGNNVYPTVYDEGVLVDSGASTMNFKGTNVLVTSEGEGVAIEIGGEQKVDSIAELQTLSKTAIYKSAFVTNYYSNIAGGGGKFYLDSADTTSPHNGVTVIVAADGGRWKLRHFGSIDVRQAGAKGDGTTDDGPAIQAALDVCALQRIGTLTFSNGIYRTGQQLLIRQGAQTTSSDVGSDIHFMSDMNKLVITSDSHATLKASAVIASLLKYSPTTVSGSGSYANFYSQINGLLLDGNNQASVGIVIDSSMHITIEENSIFNVVTGISNTGYGVHNIVRNVIRATVGCNYTNGGDSKFEHNDIYCPAGGSGLLLKPFAGSTLILRNTFTPTDTTIANSTMKAIELRADNVGDDIKVLGAIRILSNCFDGVQYGVYGRGFSNAIKNIKSIEIAHNYIGAAGACVTCNLVDFAFATSLNIHNNDVTPGRAEPKVRSLGTLFGVRDSHVHANNIYSCTSDGLVLDGVCQYVTIESNKFMDVGIGATSNAFVRIQGSCDLNYVIRNEFVQTDGTGALNGVVETGSVNRTIAYDNEMFNIGLVSTEYVKVGASSNMKSHLRQAAAPGTGTWIAGAMNERPAPAAGTFMYDICTTGGTPGTWKTAGAITP